MCEVRIPPEKTALVACDVFRDEIAAIGGEQPPWRSVVYRPMGLHDEPDKLRAELQKTITETEEDGEVEVIVLAYAMCGNGLLGLRGGRCPLVLPRAHDCITVLLGNAARQQSLFREEPGTYFYSPGWVRERRVPGPDRAAFLREYYEERFGDDEDMIEELVEADAESFSHYKRAVYLDLTGNEQARSYCRKCADQLGWKYEEMAADASFLRGLLLGPWGAERYLVVQPGERISASNDEQIVRAEKVK